MKLPSFDITAKITNIQKRGTMKKTLSLKLLLKLPEKIIITFRPYFRHLDIPPIAEVDSKIPLNFFDDSKTH